MCDGEMSDHIFDNIASMNLGFFLQSAYPAITMRYVKKDTWKITQKCKEIIKPVFVQIVMLQIICNLCEARTKGSH